MVDPCIVSETVCHWLVPGAVVVPLARVVNPHVLLLLTTDLTIDHVPVLLTRRW